MKKFLSLILILSLILLTLAGCIGGNTNDNQNNGGQNGDGSSDSTEKQVPIYQGMSITSANESASDARLPSVMAGTNNGNGNNGDNGNHYGQYKGDHSGNNNEPDDEDPFPDNNENENIEEEIKSTLEVIGSPDTIYYASVGEDIYINIHISNPDSFEIVSFTLNGKKYSNYMFEDGSDMENIILKYNVGEESGVIDYTIDAIKYIDGTEIKDVLINGDKTVRAGVCKDNQVSANVSGVDVGTNSISFNVNVKDNDKLVEFSDGELCAVLYDGFEIIDRVELKVGENSVSFDGLETSRVYQYAIVGHYDNFSGEGFGMNLLYKDAFSTEAVVLFDAVSIYTDHIDFGLLWHEDATDRNLKSLKLYRNNMLVSELDTEATSVSDLLSGCTYLLVAEYINRDATESISLEFTTYAKDMPVLNLLAGEVTKTSISFSINEIDLEEVGEITKIELIHNGEVVSLIDVTSTEIGGLLSGNEYTVRVTYSYNLNDDLGRQTLIREITATTEANVQPSISIQDYASTKDSISFEIAETDADGVGNITKIELIDANSNLITADTEARSFNNLLSGNRYTLRITYAYNLNDGNGNIELVEEITVSTKANAKPTISFDTPDIITDRITVDFSINDPDGVIQDYRFDLYKDSQLVASSQVIDFGDLEYHTRYTLKVLCYYDLNDGAGVRCDVTEHIFVSNPKIDVLECNIANTSAVSEGETIYMQVKLDNPFNMTIDSVVVNGYTYNVTGASTPKRIFVEIVYNGQFAGGDTHLKIDKINASLGGEKYTTTPETELSDSVFINGALNIVKIEYVNEKFEPVSYAFPSEKLYVLVTVNNSTGYTIDSIGDNTGVTRLDDNRWYIPVEGEIGTNSYSVTSITYHNQYISKTALYDSVTAGCYILSSDEIVYVSTADDLKTMNEGRYYQLTGDIDLSGMEWHGGEFNGVLDGCGHSIKNMSFVGNVTNVEAYLGLFKSACGVIKNLNIAEATIIAESTSDDSVYAGFFAAKTPDHSLISFENCTVDDYSVLSVNAQEPYVGGFVGMIDGYSTAYITDSTNSGAISSSHHAGGFVGRIQYNVSISIHSCNNYGNVKGAYVGGFVGVIAFGSISIADSTNHAGISGDVAEDGPNVYSGGFIGTASNVNCTITNCENKGTVYARHPYSYYVISAGGFIGSLSDSKASIVKSNNYGKVSTATSHAGGFIGNSGNVTITFEGCENLGSISGCSSLGGFIGNTGYSNASFIGCTNNGNVDGSQDRIGGFIGTSDGTSKLTDCINNGIAHGERLVGGFIGYSNTCYLSGCTNNGAVKCNDYYAGGIIGEASSATLIGCSNTAKVSGEHTVGGLIAYIQTTATITDCTNSGDVIGDHDMDGFVAQNKELASIVDCTNTGNIVAV